MPADLKSKLQEVEEDLNALRDDRAAAVVTRDEAKQAFAATDGYKVDSDEFKAAQEATGAVGEIDDKIAEAQLAQIGILKMLGQKDPAAKERLERGGDPEARSRRSGWDASGLFEAEDVRTRLEAAASASEKNRFGGMQLGQVADRDTLAADVTGTANMRRSEYAGVVQQLFRPLRVLDLIPTGTTDGNSVPYTQEGGTFAAAETLESAAKPEDGVTFTDATAPVQTIAAWQKLRKQSLSDFALLQTLIETRLRYSVQRRLEAQILNGNGSDPNLQGILGTSGIGTVATSSGTVELADQVLKGVTQIYLSDAEASGIVVHPTDWQNILSAKAAGDGHYFSAGPFSMTPQVMWGVPLVPHAAIAQGTALVGDFSLGVTLLIREGVNVLLSDSDQDDFIKNKVTLLGEMRAALPVWRPAAFSAVTLS